MLSIQGFGRPSNCNKNKEIDLRDIESTIVTRVKERLETLPDQPVAATIFKVPHTITSGQPEAYRPKFISIGPFNHNRNFPDDHQTKAAETHKIWYLRDFLKRDDRQPREFKDYVSGILHLEGEARNCYSEEIPLSSEDLVEGMALDACFIIELFLKLDDQAGIAIDDPIYSSLLIQQIAYDLLLLENQLPFFILEDVYKRFNEKRSSCKPLTDLAMNFFNMLVRRKDAEVQVQSDSVHHLLHLVYLHFEIDQESLYNPSNLKFLCDCNFFPFHHRQRSSDEAQLPTQQVTIPSATVLHDAGVKFSKGNNTNFLAIKFNNGRLEMPAFFLDDSSDSFMRNLIAFEQCYPLSTRYYSFTLYAYFMNCLVKTGNDAKILCKSGIIQHALGSDEEAAGFFNSLCTGLVISFEKTHLGAIFEQLNEYYSFLPRTWWAKYVPIFSLGGLLLLLLTVLQALFSILQYFKD